MGVCGERSQGDGPRTLRISRSGQGLITKAPFDRAGGLGGAPDGDGLVALQHHVVPEDARDIRLGGCGGGCNREEGDPLKAATHDGEPAPLGPVIQRLYDSAERD